MEKCLQFCIAGTLNECVLINLICTVRSATLPGKRVENLAKTAAVPAAGVDSHIRAETEAEAEAKTSQRQVKAVQGRAGQGKHLKRTLGRWKSEDKNTYR